MLRQSEARASLGRLGMRPSSVSWTLRVHTSDKTVPSCSYKMATLIRVEHSVPLVNSTLRV